MDWKALEPGDVVCTCRNEHRQIVRLEDVTEIRNDALYFLDNNRAILSSFDARTGKVNYSQQRLEGVQGVYASPVGAKGRVYIAGRNGVTAVIAHGPEFKLLATNTLDDTFDASPAIAGKELYLRGHEYLYCIAGE